MKKGKLKDALEIIQLQQETEYCNGALTIHSKSLTKSQGYCINCFTHDINEIIAPNLTSL